MSQALKRLQAKRRAKTVAMKTPAANSAPQEQIVVKYRGTYLPRIFENYMRYSETWNDSTAGGASYAIYRFNDMNDPYAGAGGQQHHGHDEMAALYDKVRVLDVECILEALNNGSEPVQVALYASTHSTAPTFTLAEAAPGRVSALLNYNAGKAVVLRKFIRSRDLAGPAAEVDEDYAASPGATPTIPLYVKWLLKNVGTSALNVTIKWTMVTHCRWTRRHEVDDA